MPMMPRPSSEAMDNNSNTGYSQSGSGGTGAGYGDGGRSGRGSYASGGYGGGPPAQEGGEMMQRFMPGHQQHHHTMMMENTMMQQQQLGAMGYAGPGRHPHHDMGNMQGASAGSPNVGPMAGGQYIPDISPNMGHPRTGFAGGIYQQQMHQPPQYHPHGSSSPTFAGMADMEGRPSPATGQVGSGVTQQDREEELLLNLLIARRQRGRMSGDDKGTGGRSSQALVDELARVRQSRQMRGAPPGMPPFIDHPGGGMMAGNTLPPVSHMNAGILPPSGYDTYIHRKPEHAGLHFPDERIDRSPGRGMMDARSLEMRDFSGRSFKQMGSYEQQNLKYQAQLEMQGLGMNAAKKKRTHKKKPSDMPRRPLSAYNLFFSEERERILKEIEKKEGGGDAKDEGDGADSFPSHDEKVESKEEDGEDDAVGPSKPKALLRSLIPAQKKRRPHRKTHGKISFQELARMVGERWKNLESDRRKYYQDLAQEDMKRQKAAMEEYYAKQNASGAPGVKEEDRSPEEVSHGIN